MNKNIQYAKKIKEIVKSLNIECDVRSEQIFLEQGKCSTTGSRFKKICSEESKRAVLTILSDELNEHTARGLIFQMPSVLDMNVDIRTIVNNLLQK